MANTSGPHTLNWVNPVTNTDGTAYDNVNENAGYTLSIDGTGEVSIPLQWSTSFDMATLASWNTMAVGDHTASLAVVTKEGVTGAFSTPVTFHLNAVTPTAPTDVTVA